VPNTPLQPGPKAARTLAEAINTLAPEQTLEFSGQPGPGQDPSFYTDRDGNPFQRIKIEFLTTQTREKILFTGHRGCGKSTELNRLAADPEILNKFLVVKYSVFDVLDPNDVKFIDLLFSIAAQTYTRALDEGLPLAQSLFDRLNRWRQTIQIAKIDKEEAEVEVKGRLKAFFLEAMGRLQRGVESKREVREVLEPRLTDLMEITNTILDEVRLALRERDILLIIDDIEKAPISVGRNLFVENASVLIQPRCKIVYTLPIALYCSHEFPGTIAAVGTSHLLPNFHVITPKGQADAKTIRQLSEMVAKRLDPSLIDPDHLEKAIVNSGGVTRDIMRVLRAACTIALTRGGDRILGPDVDQSLAEIRNQYNRFLTDDHFAILQKVVGRKAAGSSQVELDLIHALAILEYLNGEQWVDVHPMVKPLLDAWTKRQPKPGRKTGKKTRARRARS
jgi:energy-coupling factor transporter ATP-binding protein EcfA2